MKVLSLPSPLKFNWAHDDWETPGGDRRAQGSCSTFIKMKGWWRRRYIIILNQLELSVCLIFTGGSRFIIFSLKKKMSKHLNMMMMIVGGLMRGKWGLLLFLPHESEKKRCRSEAHRHQNWWSQFFFGPCVYLMNLENEDKNQFPSFRTHRVNKLCDELLLGVAHYTVKGPCWPDSQSYTRVASGVLPSFVLFIVSQFLSQVNLCGFCGRPRPDHHQSCVPFEPFEQHWLHHHPHAIQIHGETCKQRERAIDLRSMQLLALNWFFWCKWSWYKAPFLGPKRGTAAAFTHSMEMESNQRLDLFSIVLFFRLLFCGVN